MTYSLVNSLNATLIGQPREYSA